MPTSLRLLLTGLLPLVLLLADTAAAGQSGTTPAAPTVDAPQIERVKLARKFETVVVPPPTAAERRLKRETERSQACEHYTGSRLEHERSRKKRCPNLPGIAIKRSDLDKGSAASLGEFLRD